MENTELVLNTMKKAGKPLKSGEIADLSKISKTIVDKTIKYLQKNGKIISPKRCFYEIKE